MLPPPDVHKLVTDVLEEISGKTVDQELRIGDILPTSAQRKLFTRTLGEEIALITNPRGLLTLTPEEFAVRIRKCPEGHTKTGNPCPKHHVATDPW